MADKRYRTTSVDPLKAHYGPEDLAGLDPERDVGLPGKYPFTRGVHETMYRGRLWTMRQYAGYASAEESNRRYRYLLAQGQTGLSVAFDLPTQCGYDPDDAMSAGEVGKVGVSIATLDDMEALFRGIDLGKVSTSMTINATAPVLLALYVAAAKKRGVPPAALSGTLQNDILKEYIARGTYIFPPEPSMRLATDCIEYAAEHLPKWNPISISGYHIREAGATAAQELAFTLSDGVAYVEAALARGLAVDEFAPRLSFFFGCHNNFLEEVAKFRAARKIWARLMREKYGAQDERSWKLRFHTQTDGVTLTAQQPDNNVVRVALQALAAVLGGTQSLHTNSRDEALSLPTEESARLALRTQQIVALESGVADVADPLGGSWAVESLTEALCKKSGEYMESVVKIGGMVKAVNDGYPQRLIEEAAYREQKAVESGEKVVVGVNAFADEDPAPPKLYRADPRVEARRIARLKRFKRSRRPKAAAALDALARAAQGRENTLPFLLAAVEAKATLGEICGRLRRVFGEHSVRKTF
jgi:methylmalonyl-CoA mutase, N-terminal domain